MWKALVIKELRESAGIVALAALAAVIMVTGMAGLPLLPFGVTGSDDFPFVSDTFLFYMGVVVGLLAVALGLKQSAWETGSGTYYFLLHRPVDRVTIFAIKVIIGITIVLGFGVAMILFYAAWAAAPGHSGVPFLWSMTFPSWRLLASLSIVYVGAFFSGIRPARWYGSRLGPVIAAGFVVAALALTSPWGWLTVAVTILFVAINLAAIFLYVNSRDY
ncbi:MAG TPA: hypothetical protein VH107_05700 [Lacipirellulaceae bacterium]|jgi:hypothetical protein|nr:hypothetical protein [Lacipirellulaceae bacterium]